MQQQQQQQQQQQAHVRASAQTQAQRIRARNHYDILVGEGFRGTKRDKPTDRSLPPFIKRQVKESAIYNDLQRMERNLDWIMACKRAELMDSMGKPPKVKRTLRIFLSNTCANQPFQVAEKEQRRDATEMTADADDGDGGDDDDSGAAAPRPKSAAKTDHTDAVSYTHLTLPTTPYV